MRHIISVLLLFSFFSCHKKEYNEKELLKAFLNHSYYSYSETDIKNAMKRGMSGIKAIDKNFEIIPLKGKRVKKVEKNNKAEFFYPFILKKHGNNYLIVKVFDYSIAFEAGLKNGVLNSINSKNIDMLDPYVLEKEIENSEELSISFNDGKGDWNMKLKKELKSFPFVWSLALDENSAYVNLLSISKNSAEYFKNNITNISRRGIKNLIIDLRGVSGGNYDDAAIITGYFSKDKKSYSIKSSKKGYNKEFIITENPFTNFNLIVLTDGETKLLGEIMAQTLKENGAVIVGEKTGADIYITKLFKVGNNSAANITVAKLYPPSQKDMDDGLIPDYTVSFSEYRKFAVRYVIDSDPVIAKAMELLGIN